jgi:SAM-dependent methyltransferase
VGFAVPADAYDRFMGRYSVHLSAQLADLAGVTAGQRVIDVGCGPGALTTELVGRVGARSVVAVDPSESFVDAARARLPEVDIRHASAEQLPFSDDEFDTALAQLVVHFMTDPVGGLAEMRRVTRPGGVIAACVWDHGGGKGPLSPLWQAAHELDPTVTNESELPGSRHGDLTRLFEAAGLENVEETALTVRVEHPTFDEWWDPFTLGVGPAGAYIARLEPEQKAALREQCRATLPDAPFVLESQAWTARGLA